eukprot:3491903-Amphidinium_carterae.1
MPDWGFWKGDQKSKVPTVIYVTPSSRDLMYVFRHLVIDEMWSFDVDEQLSIILERVRNMTPAGQRSSNRDEISVASSAGAVNMQQVNSLQAIKKRRD